MPKPNYAFAKRQRETAKKQKKEAKLRERAAEKASNDTTHPSIPAAPRSDSQGD